MNLTDEELYENYFDQIEDLDAKIKHEYLIRCGLRSLVLFMPYVVDQHRHAGTGLMHCYFTASLIMMVSTRRCTPAIRNTMINYDNLKRIPAYWVEDTPVDIRLVHEILATACPLPLTLPEISANHCNSGIIKTKQLEAKYKKANQAVDLIGQDWDTISTKKVENPISLLSLPLWGDTSVPAFALHNFEKFEGFVRAGSDDWEFWLSWYRGLMCGKPIDWNLQHKIASVSAKEWSKGINYIADQVKAISRDFEAQTGAHLPGSRIQEPTSVARLVENPHSSDALLSTAAALILDAENAYRNGTGENCLPPELESLTTIRQSLISVNREIRLFPAKAHDASELLAEVSRLNERVIELETQLEAIKQQRSSTFATALKEQSGKSLGDWRMWGALSAAIWFVSGDIDGVISRVENIASLRDTLFGPISEPEKPDLSPSTSV